MVWLPSPGSAGSPATTKTLSPVPSARSAVGVFSGYLKGEIIEQGADADCGRDCGNGIHRGLHLCAELFTALRWVTAAGGRAGYSVIAFQSTGNGRCDTIARIVVCVCRSTSGLAEPPSGSPQVSSTSEPNFRSASLIMASEIQLLTFDE